MVSGRIRSILDGAQPVDQAGFRAGFSVDDHLITMVLLMEKSNEFNIPVWLCAVDFTKAFDTVSHDSVSEALAQQGVPWKYIRTLAALYEQQTGRVVADKTSKPFDIRRGTKQGDPISPQLFNAVLENALKEVQITWRQKGWGISLGELDSDRITNLRFADDLILIASSREILGLMIKDLMHAVTRVGLELHMGKTKILTNQVVESKGSIQVESHEIKIVESTEYLGRVLTFTAMHEAEVDHWIWAA